MTARPVLVRRLRRGTIGLAIVLVAALVLTTGYSIWTVRRSLPAVNGQLDVSGLTSEVTVLRDASGIPQIYADNPHDLFLAQGFVQAQDRFWQMDVHRHATQGRLAAMFGEDLVSRDAFVRTLGWERVASREWQLLQPRTRRYLQAYSDGVNAYLQRHDGADISAEYAILGLRSDYEPPEWTPVDSLTWLKAMAWSLRTNLGQEVDRALLAVELPRRRVEQLYPDYPYDRHPPIVRHGRVTGGEFRPPGREYRTFDRTDAGAQDTAGAPASEAPAALRDEMPDVADFAAMATSPLGVSGLGVGSNSWVVSGALSQTGQPLLANDPHLGPTLPSIWYQMGLHCTSVSSSCPFDVSGFTFPGLPGVVIGHNADIAWGFTNLGADVTDLFLERVRGDTYRYEGAWRPLRTRSETIEIAGGKPVTIEVRATKHGPLVSDVRAQLRRVGVSAPVPKEATSGSEASEDGYAVALRWTALDPGRTADAIFALNTADDWQSFRDAAQLFAVPAQNLVYADVRGNIGYQAPGDIPIRAHGDGSWPVPGWTDRYEWRGFVEFDELPYVFNPERGYIVTANNTVIGPSYPHTLTEDWSFGYRSDRIAERIERAGKLSVREMVAIQQDTHNANAATLVPYLLRVDVGGASAEAQALLRNWDYQQTAESAAAAYFGSVWRHLLALTFHDELPRSTWPSGGGRWFEVVRGLVEDADSKWWDDVDTARLETRDDIIRRALRQGYRELSESMGDQPREWSWGELHTLTLTHQSFGTSGIGVLEWMFNRGPLRVSGGPSIVNATSWDAAEGYDITALPSMRMVVDLADFDASRWINLTGASGHVYSHHYVDQAQLWRQGRTTPFAFSREAVRRAAEDRLILRPAS